MLPQTLVWKADGKQRKKGTLPARPHFATPGVRWTGWGVIGRAKAGLAGVALAASRICLCLIGLNDLMRMSYPAAVGDATRTRVRQSFRRKGGAGIISAASRRH